MVAGFQCDNCKVWRQGCTPLPEAKADFVIGEVGRVYLTATLCPFAGYGQKEDICEECRNNIIVDALRQWQEALLRKKATNA